MSYPEQFGAYQNMYPSSQGFQPPMPQPSQPVPRYQVAVVEGEKGVYDFPMGPNSSIFLADKTDKNRIWFCATDDMGFKKVRAITCSFPSDENNIDDISKRLKKLEDIVNERFVNSRSSKSRTADSES